MAKRVVTQYYDGINTIDIVDGKYVLNEQEYDLNELKNLSKLIQEILNENGLEGSFTPPNIVTTLPVEQAQPDQSPHISMWKSMVIPS